MSQRDPPAFWLRWDHRQSDRECLFPSAIRPRPEPDLERYHIRLVSGLRLSPSKLTSCPRCNYTLPRYAMGHLKDNTELVARVRRIAGQVTSVEKALVSDAPCATVLHRVAAVRGAVNGLLDEIIAPHLTAHVAADGLSPEEDRKTTRMNSSH